MGIESSSVGGGTGGGTSPKGPKGPNVELGGPLKGPKDPNVSFSQYYKANAPTSPRWIWAKNMGLGKWGVIKWQK